MHQWIAVALILFASSYSAPTSVIGANFVETSRNAESIQERCCGQDFQNQFRVVLRLRGGRKGVSAKHTTSEIARKMADATTNKGGGKAGLLDRLGGAAGHAKFVCPVCKMQAPSIKNMQEHHESKHDGIPFDPEACENAHLVHGGSTKGVAVHGTLKKAKLKVKEKKTKEDSE